MRTCILFISTIIFCSCSDPQSGQNKSGIKSNKNSVVDSIHVYVNHDAFPKIVSKYNYDPKLKGGYSLIYAVDDSLQYLSLMKNTSDTIIGELNECSIEVPQKSLGYPAADFDNYFVLAQSFGSNNPHPIQLIEKLSGKNILENNALWIGANEKKGFLLYSNNDVPNKENKMILYNIRTGQKQSFNFPIEILNEPEVFNHIQIGKLTDKQLTIKYQTENGSKIKIYSR